MKQKDERRTHASRWTTINGMGKEKSYITYLKMENGNERKMCGSEKQRKDRNETERKE